MSAVLVPTLLLAGVVGVALGTLGGGGSILMVPLLLYVAGLGAKEAIATSLFVVSAASLTGVIPFARRGQVEGRLGAIFGAASMVGSYAGGRLAGLLSEDVLILGFAAVMFVTAIAMMRRRASDSEPGVAEPAPAPPKDRGRIAARLAAIGLAVGVLSGLVGAGGGFVIVPALVLAAGLPMKKAIGTSLMIIGLTSAAGLAGHLAHTELDLGFAAMVAGAAVLGTLAGGQLSDQLPARSLRLTFSWMVLLMALVLAGSRLLDHGSHPARSDRDRGVTHHRSGSPGCDAPSGAPRATTWKLQPIPAERPGSTRVPRSVSVLLPDPRHEVRVCVRRG